MMIEIPEVPKIRGESAVKALSDAIAELEDQKGKQLTTKQTKAMIRIAKGMISSIQAEKKLVRPERKTKWSLFSRSKARETQ